MRFKRLSTTLLSITIASYCSIKRLLDKLLNSPQIPAFRMTTGISIELKPEGGENIEIRQYSLSDKPNGKTYRISVKRESGDVSGVASGVMSNYVHDHLNVGDIIDLHPPAGDFFFIDRNAPVVLISAGVGITPMQAMLEKLADENYENKIHYLHACENSSQHSFLKRTTQICYENNWHNHTWYSSEESKQNNIHHGFIDFNKGDLPLDNGNFYICGPVGFMKFAKNSLLDLGVDHNNIHYEVFGPHAEL